MNPKTIYYEKLSFFSTWNINRVRNQASPGSALGGQSWSFSSLNKMISSSLSSLSSSSSSSSSSSPSNHVHWCEGFDAKPLIVRPRSGLPLTIADLLSHLVERFMGIFLLFLLLCTTIPPQRCNLHFLNNRYSALTLKIPAWTFEQSSFVMAWYSFHNIGRQTPKLDPPNLGVSVRRNALQSWHSFPALAPSCTSRAWTPARKS